MIVHLYGMGLTFTRWLKLVENEQQTELQVARFLEGIIDNAAHAMQQDMKNGQANGFNTYIKQFWPPEAVQHRLVLPDNFPEGVAGQPVDFKYTTENTRAYCWHVDGKFSGFVINMTPFRKAKSPQELDQAVDALKAALHHECEHIYNPGDDYNPGEDDDALHKTLEYLSNPGEIRAHAREIAWGYAKNFPGQPFDLQKAQSMLDQPYFNMSHKNYLVKLSDPRKWAELSQKYQLQQNPHTAILQVIQQILPQYSK